jgi:hypothetical protein
LRFLETQKPYCHNLALNHIIIFSSFSSVLPYCKDDFRKKQFEDHLVLFITKDLHVLLLSFVHFFFKRLLLRQNLQLNFPSKQKLEHDLLLRIVKMTKERFVSSSLVSCNTCIVSFDLRMSKGGVDTFVLIMYLLNDKWWPCHVTIGF